MSRLITVVALLLVASVSSAQDVRKLFESHCVRCHSPQKKKGGVDLTPLAAATDFGKHRKLIRRVMEQIDTGAMPPPAEPQLDRADRDRIGQWGKQAMVLSEPKDPTLRNPGPALIRRLHRYEYNRTLRDLLGIDLDIATAAGMPDEAATHSFDNLADGLSLSPVLMEKFFTGADIALDHLFKTPKGDPKKATKSALDLVVIARPTKDVSASDAARTIAEAFVPRAFRRPAEKAEVDRFVKLFDDGAKSGEPFEASVKRMLKAVLVSPHFLLRIERDRPGVGTNAYRVNDQELASRLAYFLWSSPPDAELARLADDKTLSDPKVFAEQVRRMLKDPRAYALTENFAGQWTKIRKLANARPSIEFFPTFNPRMKDAMTAEVLAFFDNLRTENRSVLELLDADYTFANEDLSKHYGLSPIKGPEMRKVSIGDAKQRGGLSSMAGVLAMTSHTSRTSPTLRGAWVLEVIFGTPPEPPPPDVGQIQEESGKGKDVKSFRELLERHAKEASCAGCHKRIDPLGFGLENFDPIGRWRPTGGPQKIDPRGVLPSGEKFDGPKELRAIFLNRKNDFLRNLAEQMLTYSLGRQVQHYDEAAVREIAAKLEADPRFETWILAVAESYPFQYRRNSDVAAE